MSLSLSFHCQEKGRAEGWTLCPGNGARGCSGRTPAEPNLPMTEGIVIYPEQYVSSGKHLATKIDYAGKETA
jgi:hypothetical protein